MSDRCHNCGNGTPGTSSLTNRRSGTSSTDISLLTAIDGAVGHKMRIWAAQKKELEAKIESQAKELQKVLAERSIREDFVSLS